MSASCICQRRSTKRMMWLPIEIAREGLKIHHTFIGGRVSLGRALFDKQFYAEVIDEMTTVVRDEARGPMVGQLAEGFRAIRRDLRLDDDEYVE